MKGSAVRIRASASEAQLRFYSLSTAGRNRLLGGCGAAGALRTSFFAAIRGCFSRQGGVQIEDSGRLDRRRAIRTDLPERLDWSLAGPARLFQVGGADRADEERRLDGRPADRALRLSPLQCRFERAELHPVGPSLLEGLRRAEEEVGERAGNRDEAEEHGCPDEERIVDLSLGIAVRPVRAAEPEENSAEEREILCHHEGGRMKDG